MVPRAVIASLLAAAAIALPGGCGDDGDGEEERVSEVVTSFVEAGSAGDAERACALIAGPIGGAGCEGLLAGILAGTASRTTDVEVSEVAIEGDRASAEATLRAPGDPARTATVRLVRVDGAWRIAAAGG